MAYDVHNYQSGAKLYASQLNEMDEQIADIENGTNIESTVSAESIVWTNGQSIQISGDAYLNAAYSYATVAINKRDKRIYGYTRAGAENTLAIAFHDKDGNLLYADYHAGSGTYDWNYDFQIPEGSATAKSHAARS